MAVFLSMADVVRRVANTHDAVQGYVPGIDRFGNVQQRPDPEGPRIVFYGSITGSSSPTARGSTPIWSAISGAPSRSWLVFEWRACPTPTRPHRLAFDLKRALDSAGIGLGFATMRETLRVDLADGQVLARIGEENLFETVDAAVAAAGPDPGGDVEGADAQEGEERSTIRAFAYRRTAAAGGQVQAPRPAQGRDPDDVVHRFEDLRRQAVRPSPSTHAIRPTSSPACSAANRSVECGVTSAARIR